MMEDVFTDATLILSVTTAMITPSEIDVNPTPSEATAVVIHLVHTAKTTHLVPLATTTPSEMNANTTPLVTNAEVTPSETYAYTLNSHQIFLNLLLNIPIIAIITSEMDVSI